jgi:hypothetical protein
MYVKYGYYVRCITAGEGTSCHPSTSTSVIVPVDLSASANNQHRPDHTDFEIVKLAALRDFGIRMIISSSLTAAQAPWP